MASDVQKAYATDQQLSVRYQVHQKYSVPRMDFRTWVLDRIRWQGNETVLDLGCGPGIYAETLLQHAPDASYFGLDFSAGMLAKHPVHNQLTQADAQQLPFVDHSFDVVMANHMLYHVPDIDMALAEIHRVLKPGGMVIAATNSSDTMPQFRDLYKRAIMVLTSPGKQVVVPQPASHAFTLESGVRQLSRHFYGVVRYDLPGAFVFDAVEPVISYLESSRPLREPQLPSDVSWDAVMMIVQEQVKNQLNYVGQLVVHKLSGVLIASDRGGFIRDFVHRREATVD